MVIKMKAALIWISFVAFVLITGCASGGKTAAGERVSAKELEAFRVTIYTEKEQIPLDELFTLEGTPYDGGALLGKYVLVNFWAARCPYCRAEKPSMQRIYDRYKGERFTLLAVSVGEDADTVMKYMGENGLDMPLVLDRENVLRERYAPGIPTSYIVDCEGNIVARINGNKEWDSKQALKILRHLVPEIAGVR